ncbi:MAG: tetratricopeptide repeat protein [Bacteroidales bacterium]|jgi:tetratricopeptide (TPR) repeat protein|nr:tetratricopeptide repeat protein [Bacteroidales bacterium]
MKKIILILATISLFACSTFAQKKNKIINTPKNNNDSIFSYAIKAIDNNEYFKAESLLKQIVSQDSMNLKYNYELAWTYYLMKEYKRTINILTPLTKYSSSADIYQLLGNAYDEIQDKSKAATIYNEGLEKYPFAGNLYLELGNLKYEDGEYQDALYYYEKGIEINPKFASNYYRASLVFFKSTEEVWGVMYGEIFMNLEKGSERSKSFSKDLFDTYFNCINLDRSSVNVDFNNNTIVYSNSFERPNLFPKMFNKIMTESCRGKNYLNIATLIDIRKNFIRKFYQSEKTFDNIIFQYQKKLIELGYFDAYNYWLFGYGNNKEASSWINSHKNEWNQFNSWFKNNSFPIDSSNVFSRYKME